MVFIDCSPDQQDTYYCGRDVNDQGWGCVYRCAQTLMASMFPGSSVITLHDMIRLLEIDTTRGSRAMWIEPKQVIELLNAHCDLTWTPRLIGVGIKGNEKRMLRTTRSDFNVIYDVADVALFHNTIVRHLRLHNTPVVVDDGVTGLCISGYRGSFGDMHGVYIIIDPHMSVPGTQRYEMKVDDFYARAPMMMAVVA